MFRQQPDESGTPFIEIDPSVTDYVQDSGDSCVKKMYWRMVKADGDLVAVLPYQLLSHSFAVGGMFGEFQPERERQSVRNVRKWITDMKANVSLGLDDPSNDSATRKRKQCLRMLDAQLQLCDRIDAMIAQMERGS